MSSLNVATAGASSLLHEEERHSAPELAQAEMTISQIAKLVSHFRSLDSVA
jgi:hypothetical protein